MRTGLLSIVDNSLPWPMKDRERETERDVEKSRQRKTERWREIKRDR